MAIQPGGSRPPFFCVHPAGGNVLCYAPLARCLGADQPFYGLQARGSDGRGSFHEDVSSMAADYLEAIRSARPEGPYLLGGWSVGGVVAFEIARQLHSQGQEVAVLALIDPSTPGTAAAAPQRDDAPHLDQLARDLIKNNVRAVRAYEPRCFEGRITLFRPRRRTVGVADLAAGWDRLAAGGIEIHTVGGDHDTMMTEPQVQELARVLGICLAGIRS